MAEQATVADGVFPANRKTPLPGGYMGRVLRVNLSTEKFETLPLPEEPLLKKLWGGQALALREGAQVRGHVRLVATDWVLQRLDHDAS